MIARNGFIIYRSSSCMTVILNNVNVFLYTDVNFRLMKSSIILVLNVLNFLSLQDISFNRVNRKTNYLITYFLGFKIPSLK